MHSIVTNLISSQDVANKRERNITSKSYPIQQPVTMHCYGSLININPSGRAWANGIIKRAT